MKISSKLHRSAVHTLMITTLGVSLIAPTAGATGAVAQATQAVRASNACSKVDSFGQKALSNITDRVNKLNSTVSADAAKRLQQEQTFDAKVATDRAHWDQVRDQNFAKLDAEAKTDHQKAAVAAFKQTVLAAVTTRRGAVDQDRDTFRTAVSQDAAARQSQLNQAISTFQTAVNSAIAQAKASCSSSDPGKVGATFVAALKQARENFQSAITAAPKLGPQVEKLAQTRTQAVQQADQTFKQTIQQAVQTLKAALGQTS